ncbi:MAG: hypothetical protein FJX74_22025, partial [Armatimonadetes bacterium]|nr:hypothetical protein [Armatimonadota bacterium]
MTHSRYLPIVAAALVGACLVVWVLAWRSAPDARPAAPNSGSAEAPRGPSIPYEEWARLEFLRRHPGEKPLNWRIGQKAEEFAREHAMGRFVLHRNDCSDFADCVLDDALGAKARFRREADRHILASEPSLWEFYRWEPASALIPGDELAVRHSP